MTTESELAALAAEAQGTSPQLVWAVVLDGRIALHGGSTSTVFRIASMTKSYTAATVLALRDGGELRLDDEIEVLADQRPTADSPPVTIRDVLSMSSGLPGDDPWADRHLDMDPAELDRLVRAGVAYAFPTGTAYEYSNLGYALLGDLSARTTELLLEPLGLTHTTWTHPTPGALGHGAFAGMGGLWSNLEDLATWVTWSSTTPSRHATTRTTVRCGGRRGGRCSRCTAARVEGGGYGYGVQVRFDDRLGTVVDHSGGLPGYGSNMRWLPGRRVGVIALANSTYAPMGALTRRMLEVLDANGLVPAAVIPLTPALQQAAGELVALLSNWDDAVADRIFSDNVALDQPYAERAAAAAELGSLQVERIDGRVGDVGDDRRRWPAHRVPARADWWHRGLRGRSVTSGRCSCWSTCSRSSPWWPSSSRSSARPACRAQRKLTASATESLATTSAERDAATTRATEAEAAAEEARTAATAADTARAEAEARAAQAAERNGVDPDVLWTLEQARSERTWRQSVAVGDGSFLDGADDPLLAALQVELDAAREDVGAIVELDADCRRG